MLLKQLLNYAAARFTRYAQTILQKPLLNYAAARFTRYAQAAAETTT